MVHLLSTADLNSSKSDKQFDSAESTSAESLSINPQDAHAPTARRPEKKVRKRKRGRVVRVAAVEEEPVEHSSTLLPSNQYQAVLRRRAIRKEKVEINSNQLDKTEEEGESIGDISLGMKIIILGGKVIVQALNSLSDGRASPAQLAGVICRGDVLLAIDKVSLVNLQTEQLPEALRPLSTPDATGCYQRILQLRFATGEGLQLLEKMKSEKSARSGSREGREQMDDLTNELLSFFPIVEQLSARPSQEPVDETTTVDVNPIPQPTIKEQSNREDVSQAAETLHLQNALGEQQKPLDTIISRNLANTRKYDKEKFISEFFTLNEKHSDLLRPALKTPVRTKQLTETALSRSQLVALGKRALLGATSIGRNMEALDRGIDVLSLRNWSSTISLRSRTSNRRRCVLEVMSLPASVQMKSPSEDDELSRSASSESGDLDGCEGDEIILNLAAHDEIWRKQVLDELRKVISALHRDHLSDVAEDAETPAEDGIDAGFGNFLLGETMSKIVTEKRKSKVLPPEDITAVLFDLASSLFSAILPETIDVEPVLSRAPLRAMLHLDSEKKQKGPHSEVYLATRFMLDKALPLWLKAFKPLQWNQRRVLWPLSLTTAAHDGTTAGRSCDDSLTVDTMTTSFTSRSGMTSMTGGKRSKNLREQIEEQELNAETRAETCFLVTYYFTLHLLPKVAGHGKKGVHEELVEFVKYYGSYLKIHTCLAYSAGMECEDVVSVLLQVAEFDPQHQQAMKQITSVNSLILYDATILSAIMKCLHIIQKNPNADRRLTIIHACVSAYPDLQPWQVRKECLLDGNTDLDTVNCSKEELRELYYTYLSLLLHPSDGHDEARRDGGLVEEWCVLSLQQFLNSGAKKEISLRRSNFYSVASRSCSDHVVYHRDIVMLLKLSMSSGEFDVALDLISEILDHDEHLQHEEIRTLLLRSLRIVANSTLDGEWPPEKVESVQLLKRSFEIFQKMASNTIFCSFQDISIADELHSLLRYKKSGTAGNTIQISNLIHFLATEALPSDSLQAFSSWAKSQDMSSDVVFVLQILLKRGAQISMTNELSGSLLHLKRARRNFNEVSLAFDAFKVRNDTSQPPDGIWRLMSKGMLKIDK